MTVVASTGIVEGMQKRGIAKQDQAVVVSFPTHAGDSAVHRDGTRETYPAR